MPLFDRCTAVDWSGNNAPKLGADSIWACMARRAEPGIAAANYATRRAAESWLTAQLTAAVEAGERILVGIDFPYGYPAGFADALGLSGAAWRATWSYLTWHVTDDEKNRSNRFEVASEINAALGPRRPFWGRPVHLDLPGLPVRKEVTYRAPGEVGGVAEWREVERVIHTRGARPQPVWKLCYTGSVGSQTLLGIPVLDRLRRHHILRAVSHVWPLRSSCLTCPQDVPRSSTPRYGPPSCPSPTNRAAATTNARCELWSRGGGSWIEQTASPTGLPLPATVGRCEAKKVGSSAWRRSAPPRDLINRSGSPTQRSRRI